MEENPDGLADDVALMTLDQLAAYLQVDPQTVMRLARTGKVPSHRVGKQFRFLRSAVLRSLQHQPNPLFTPDEVEAQPSEGRLTRRRRLGPRPKIRPVN
jgi:excisionase family DNA binding protein